jgi:hypothetical protein
LIFWLFIFDIYCCLIDTLFSSVLFIMHPYFLVCFFAFSYSLPLSLPHCFLVAFNQDWKVPKINRSVPKKMEEPLNILTIGPEQMNKCSGEDTLLA